MSEAPSARRPGAIEIDAPNPLDMTAHPPSAATFQPFRAWTSVAILMLFSLFSMLDRQIIALLVEPIKRDLLLSDTQLGLLSGLAFALLYAVAGLPIGWAVDRYPRRIIVFLGITVWSLSCAACGLARDFWQLAIGRTFVGVGEASLSPSAVSLIGDLFPKERMALPMGMFSASFYLGSGAALAIGGWIAGLFPAQGTVDFPVVGALASWQAVFVVAGLPGAAFAFLAFLIHDPRRRGTARRRDGSGGFAAFLQSRSTVIAFALLAYSLANFINYAVAAWTPAYFIRVLGWRVSEIGWTYGLMVAASGTTGALIGGAVMDRVYRAGYSDAYFRVGGIAAIAATPFVMAAYAVSSGIVALCLLSIGLTLQGVVAAGCYATWQRIAPPAFRGRMTALFVLVAALAGTGLGPLTVGIVTDYVFGDELLLGRTLATLAAVSLPSSALAFLLGARHLRAVPDHESSIQTRS